MGVISKKLLELYPNDKEGSLDKKLASLVNKNKCLEIGKNLKLDKYILIGNTKKKNFSHVENKVISDCCEALIGAVYIEKGFEIVEKFILRVWDSNLKTSGFTEIDAKLASKSLKNLILPIYKVISSTGPRHKPNFKVAVKLKDPNFVEYGKFKEKCRTSCITALLNILIL